MATLWPLARHRLLLASCAALLASTAPGCGSSTPAATDTSGSSSGPDALHCTDLSGAEAPVGAVPGAPALEAPIQVTYLAAGETDPYGMVCEPYPDDARAAFDAAVATWNARVRTAVPIRITACWTDFRVVDPRLSGTTGVAAGVRAFRNFPNAPRRDVCYVTSLANALAGYDLDPDHPDMHVSYNSGLAVPWYTGTDGHPGEGQIDLRHVATHEITHGLGFYGSARYDADSGQGTVGVDGYPLAYDVFVIDGVLNRVARDYAQGSVELGAQLVSDALWFDGPQARAANGGRPVKIFAPRSWMQGSSYMHLDAVTFDYTADELMIFTFFPGRAAPDVPGPVITGVLRDLGWTLADP